MGTLDRINLAFPYIFFTVLVILVIRSNFAGEQPSHHTYAEPPNSLPATQTEATTDPRGKKLNSKRLFDPVCRMEINPAWSLPFFYEGRTYYFCTERCRKIFAADPDAYMGERCMVCRKPTAAEGGWPSTYLGNTYYLCSEDHRRAFQSDPAKYFMHRMWGIPDWLYYVSIALVLVVSFAMFEGVLPFGRQAENKLSVRRAGLKKTGSDRVNVMRWRVVRTLLLSRPFRFFVQLMMSFAFMLIIAAGLFGNQNPALNIAPILTWTIWWCGLVVMIMFLGKAWCYMCPWDTLACWIEKLRLWRKTDEGLGLGMQWPRGIRNIALAIALFVALTWIELGFNVTMRPKVTAYLGIGMLVLAIVSAFLFERKSFCRYGCLVGRVSGLYAMFSAIEVRHKSSEVCSSCKGKQCYNGSQTAYGCPTFEFPAMMVTNTYCIQCTECLQACPYDNIGVNLRPWGADLAITGKPRSDEAYLALLMLAITGFHGLTMTPVWEHIITSIESLTLMGRIGAFSTGMLIIMGFPIVVYAALVWLSRMITIKSDPKTVKQISYRQYFVRYAYCVLPIALFYHLAHNAEHLLMEGPKVLAIISDPFGWGWNLLGTAGLTLPPLVSLDVLWVLQVMLVGVGHVYSLWVAQKISRRIFSSKAAALGGQWPMLAGMIAFSVFSLWLLKQPMEMRTSAM